MQIHELNTFSGTPSATDYLAIDDGSETNKVPATALGVSTQMTQAEAEAGAVTESRVVAPSIFKRAVIAIASAISDVFVSMTNPKYTLDTSASSGDDYDLTQSLTSLGWLTEVVTSGVLGVKKLLHKVLMATPRKVTITGTTTTSGALQIPSTYTTKPLFGAYREGSPSTMIYRRDATYMMVLNASDGNTFTPFANQNVTINAWTIG